ncbi:GAF sensor signal transduction histidine kinase [Fodinibius salinus]|uniref:histidine kinase n=1 Tax=Fodinibius salinus TaxID=860790 RepID=A0A5D3YJC6_9BACT|nr:HAMP domain-containing sensor histidine kinase [Fodinibius salinus]TYP93618.1 GAF sensor signal transduction histidine kinase [Fodinibius salinus]
MEEEIRRLQELAKLGIDFGKQKKKLQPFVELAKFITESPVCEINIIDSHAQWTIARTKDSLKAIPREKSICEDTIQQNFTHEIPDLSKNERYQNRIYVTEEPHFRYYCGVQLTTSDGYNIGSICVLDMEPKQISIEQKQMLGNLGQFVVDHIERESRFFQLSEQLDELKDSLRNLNHDVRGPISGIIGMADLLLGNGDHDEGLEEDVLQIKDSAQAIIEEIDGVLHTALAEDGSEKNLTQTSLSQVFEKIKRLYSPLAQQKGHDFSVKSSINKELSVPHDFSVTLAQIIGNLVGNAMKFTPEGGTITVDFSRKMEEEKQILNVSVEDSGKGMSADQKQAFNNGQRLEKSKGTADEESFGIGLDHIRQLVEKQNGDIVAESNESQGTTFSIRLLMPRVDNPDT